MDAGGGDGIDNAIDGDLTGGIFRDKAETVSSGFSDTHLPLGAPTGKTHGKIVNLPQNFTVKVEELPNPVGVSLTGIGSGGPAELLLCGLMTIFITDQDVGRVETCASVHLTVVSGTITGQVGTLNLVMPAGARVVVQTAGAGTQATNEAGSSASIVVNGVSVAPGTTADDQDGDGFLSSLETLIGTLPAVGCGVNAWPADFDDNAVIDISDALAFKPVFGATVPPTSARFDIDPSGLIDIGDVLAIKPVFGASCTA